MPEELIRKPTIIRSDLERLARNACKPPLKIEHMISMRTAELAGYVGTHRIEEPETIQDKIIDTPPVKKVLFDSNIKKEIGDAKTVFRLTKIFEQYTELHTNVQFCKALGDREKEIKNQ